MSPAQARRQLWHLSRATAKLVRSTTIIEEEDLQEAGDTYADLANDVWPILRAIVRLVAPIVLAGSLIDIWAKILDGAPWYQERKAKRQAKAAAAAGAPEPELQDPDRAAGRRDPRTPEPERAQEPDAPPVMARPLPVAVASRRVG